MKQNFRLSVYCILMPKIKAMKKWLIYDSRYLFDEDRAVCLLVCDSLKEARIEAPEYGDNNVIVETVIKKGTIVSEKVIN